MWKPEAQLVPVKIEGSFLNSFILQRIQSQKKCFFFFPQNKRML